MKELVNRIMRFSPGNAGGGELVAAGSPRQTVSHPTLLQVLHDRRFNTYTPAWLAGPNFLLQTMIMGSLGERVWSVRSSEGLGGKV